MAEELLRQSILDRLMGTDRVTRGGGSGRLPRTWEESVEVLERNVLRDLEHLLNTRQVSEPAAPPYEHLSRSLYNYGLMDIGTLSADSSQAPDEIRRQIKEAIALFEPRLGDVEVVDPLAGMEAGERAQRLRRTVRFRVEATLRTDPDPERVEFDTLLEVSSKRFEVTTESHA